MIVPARYLIPSLQTVFLAGDIWPMFVQAIAIMLLMGAVFFATCRAQHPQEDRLTCGGHVSRR